MRSIYPEYIEEQLYGCVRILAESTLPLPERLTTAVDSRLSRILNSEEESDLSDSIKDQISNLERQLEKGLPYKETINTMNDSQVREIIIEIIDLFKAVTDYIGANYHC